MPMFRLSAQRVIFVAAAVACLSTTLAVMSAAAQSAQGERRQPRSGGPPPAALAACKSLERGQTCTFSGQRGTVTGTCEAREGKALACRSENPGSRPQEPASADPP